MKQGNNVSNQSKNVILLIFAVHPEKSSCKGMDGRRGPSSEEVESGYRRGMTLTGIAGEEEEEEAMVVISLTVKDIRIGGG